MPILMRHHRTIRRSPITARENRKLVTTTEKTTEKTVTQDHFQTAIIRFGPALEQVAAILIGPAEVLEQVAVLVPRIMEMGTGSLAVDLGPATTAHPTVAIGINLFHLIIMILPQ